MTKLNPCRCCGETDHLQVNTEFVEADWTYTADNQIKREPNGAYALEPIDYVECLICNTSAPRAHWNADPWLDWPARRAATLAAWHESERASEIVSLYLREQFGKDPHHFDSMKRAGIRVQAITILQRLEKALDLPVTPRKDAHHSIVDDIVNGLAGRLKPPVSA